MQETNNMPPYSFATQICINFSQKFENTSCQTGKNVLRYFLFGEVILLICGCGGMADAADSKSAGFTIVWVQVPPSALEKEKVSGKS